MQSYLLALLAALFQLVLTASIPPGHVIHEKGYDLKTYTATAHPNTTVPVRIGLKHNANAFEQAESWLLNISDPASKHFGRFWSRKAVIEAFSPSEEARFVVEKWLLNHKIGKERITLSRDLAWLAFDATVSELQALLKTEYFFSENILLCNAYHLPELVSKHVDYVTPGVKGVKSRNRSSKRSTKSERRLTPNMRAVSSDLSQCDSTITPACIKALYQIPPVDTNYEPDSTNSLGIFEEGDYYAQQDLDSFFTRYTDNVPSGTYPILQSIDGGEAPVAVGAAGGESALDFEVAIPIIYPQTTTLYQVDDAYYARGGHSSTTGWFNTFLDALDGSYCTYSAYGETGNDPVLDPTYPNPNGYNNSLQCGVFEPTNVISISYGVQEEDSACVTIIVASGDTGVSSWPNHNGEANGCLRDGTVFNPTQPNTCPFVTSVGATKIYPGMTYEDLESAAVDPAGQPYSFAFSSGGGFSNCFPPQAYQEPALQIYFDNYNPPYKYYTNGNYMSSTGIYNRNGRGMPDVAAVGDNIAVTSNGIDFKMTGTSASAPIFAAIINRVIEERLKVGKGPLGFINPALYARPDVFNDIVNGTNPGCDTQGFCCTPGWDPVTGLGTPN